MQKVLIAAALALALAACAQPVEQAEAPAEVAASPAPGAERIALAVTDAGGAPLSGDPARGRRIFAQCASCHSLEDGVNRVGPTLHAIIGRRSGSIEGFRYSNANRIAAVTWSEQELFAYLENPRARMPGTIMAYAGLRNPQQRADLIAYLKQDAT